MFSRPNRLAAPEVNASSMADIAFLLLIFFLVTTEIVEDQGILVKLPRYDADQVVTQVSGPNVFDVLLNGADHLLVEGVPTELSDLRARVIRFVTNPAALATLPRNPRKAVVSLQNDRGTTYGAYLSVYNELQAAYHEIWDAEAHARYGVGYQSEHIEDGHRADIRADYPMVISEAEPTEFFELQPLTPRPTKPE